MTIRLLKKVATLDGRRVRGRTALEGIQSDFVDAVKAAFAAGHSVTEIADQTSVTPSRIYQIIVAKK